jgi:hypothetical protein
MRFIMKSKKQRNGYFGSLELGRFKHDSRGLVSISATQFMIGDSNCLPMTAMYEYTCCFLKNVKNCEGNFATLNFGTLTSGYGQIHWLLRLNCVTWP